MKKLSNIEEYINLIGVLENALKFYADEQNYLFFEDKDALIALDEGAQARFALDKIKEVTEARETLEADFVKNISESIENNDEVEDMLKLIEEYKKTENGLK